MKNKWSEVGLGTSGETYLVGADFTMRNQSRFLIDDEANYFTMIQKNRITCLHRDVNQGQTVINRTADDPKRRGPKRRWAETTGFEIFSRLPWHPCLVGV